MAGSPWDTLANYESNELVLRRYKAKHNWQPNAAHLREITAPFIQARQYYASAASSDRAIKPLLLYYGVVGLSRGLVLFLTRKLREAALAQAHGLSIRDWTNVLAASPPDVSNLEITVNASGSFGELVRATGNRTLIRSGSSRIRMEVSGKPIPPGIVLGFGELVARLPDVRDQFVRWQIPSCIRFSPKIEDNRWILTVYKQGEHFVDEAYVLKLFGGNDYVEISHADQEKIVLISKGKYIHGFISDYINNTLNIGDIYKLDPYKSGSNISKISQLFALSYILGMLVRYQPTFWMNLIHQRVSDAAFPTILATIDCIEMLFPSIVVDFLER